MHQIPNVVLERLKSLGLSMQRTCTAAPEQYELFAGTVPVGYIRVRWSRFSVDYPSAGEETLLDDVADGFGCFTDHEREACLLMAIAFIERRMKAS